METKLRLGIWLIFILILVSIYINILYPSYVSYTMDCGLEVPVGWCTTGVFILNTTSGESEIFIFQEPNTTAYRKSLAHELTHQRQSNRTNLFKNYNCSLPIGVYMNEVEAYTVKLFTK